MTTTDKAPRYRVLSLTNLGRGLIEEMIATDDERDARRFFRAATFPSALVEGRHVVDTNARGASHEEAFEEHLRRGPAKPAARLVAAKPVKPVEMPAREPTRAPDEPVNAREIARRAVANSPKIPEGSIEAPAANRSNSSNSSPRAEAQPEPVSVPDEFAPAPPAEEPSTECQRADCSDKPASYAPSLDPILRPFCGRHRTGIMGLRSTLSITTAEAVKRSVATGEMRVAQSTVTPAPTRDDAARCEAAGGCPNPPAGVRFNTLPCTMGLCAHHRKALYNRRDNWGLTMEEAALSIRMGADTRDDARARCRSVPVEVPPATVAEGEPSAPVEVPTPFLPPVQPLIAEASAFTLDDMRRVIREAVREEVRAVFASMLAGVA